MKHRNSAVMAQLRRNSDAFTLQTFNNKGDNTWGNLLIINKSAPYNARVEEKKEKREEKEEEKKKEKTSSPASAVFCFDSGRMCPTVRYRKRRNLVRVEAPGKYRASWLFAPCPESRRIGANPADNRAFRMLQNLYGGICFIYSLWRECIKKCRLSNYKIVSAIRQELSAKLDVNVIIK